MPREWAGRTIGQVDIRKRYSITILGVKQNGKLALSLSPDTLLPEGAALLVLGRSRDVQKCFRI